MIQRLIMSVLAAGFLAVAVPVVADPIEVHADQFCDAVEAVDPETAFADALSALEEHPDVWYSVGAAHDQWYWNLCVNEGCPPDASYSAAFYCFELIHYS